MSPRGKAAMADPDDEISEEEAAEGPVGSGEDSQVTEPAEMVPFHIEVAAQLQDIKVSAARNGANYDVTFEVPIAYLEEVANASDGMDVVFQKVAVGTGAEIRRLGITRDADGNRHVKISLHFAQSEIRQSIGFLGNLLADGQDRGVLILASPQQTVFGKRAE